MPPLHPLPVLPGVYYARVMAHSDLHPISNVFCFLKGSQVLNSPTDPSNAMAVSSAIAATWGAWVNDLLATTYNGEKVSTYALGSPLVPAQEAAMIANGTRVGTNHYDQVAGLLKHDVARRGRGSQSHTYLSPLADVDITVNGDQVTNTWHANASSFNAGFMDLVLTALGVASPGTWSYVQLSKRPTGATFPITATVPLTTISSQKRRLQR